MHQYFKRQLKTSTNFTYVSVRPFVGIEKFGFHFTNFHEM